jgi:ketosteroid isomerase-like protein
MHGPHRRLALLALICGAAVTGCQPAASATIDQARREAIADSLTGLIRAAYDLQAPDVVARLMSLYPDSGRVISASGGRVTTTQDSLEAGIRAFWTYVGRNMQEPKWTWGTPQVDVLSPDAAVVTTTYRVPHRTPAGEPHTIAGAWTAVFARRDGRWVIVQEHLSEIPPQGLAGEAAAGDTPAADPHAGHTP